MKITINESITVVTHRYWKVTIYVVEQMQSIGLVTARRMFGGHSIFLDNLMFGLVFKGVLYFKVDKKTRHYFEQKQLKPFVYSNKGADITLSYYQAPEEVFEDIDEMYKWGVQALDAALRVASNKNQLK